MHAADSQSGLQILHKEYISCSHCLWLRSMFLAVLFSSAVLFQVLSRNICHRHCHTTNVVCLKHMHRFVLPPEVCNSPFTCYPSGPPLEVNIEIDE
jgi:hypothetical protein